MAQTLEQLFKNKDLGAGQTAEAKYEIRDSKDIRISASNTFEGLLLDNTGFAAARGLRKVLSFRTDENLVEGETTGIRIIRAASEPVLYGTQLPRLVLRSTDLLDTMYEAKYGTLSDPDSLLGKLQEGRKELASTLGLPQAIIPSIVASDERLLKVGETQKRDDVIKDIKKSGEGSAWGQFLASTGGGNLSTVGTQAAGNAIKLGKDKIREKILGGNERTGIPPGYEDGVPVPSKLPPYTSTTPFDRRTLNYKSWLAVNYGSDFQAQPAQEGDGNGIIDKAGSTYSNLENINPGNDDNPFGLNTLAQKQKISLLWGPDFTLNTSFTSLNPRTIIEDTNSDGTLKDGIDDLTFSTIGEIENEDDSPIKYEYLDRIDSGEIENRELTIDRTRFSADPDRIPKSIISQRGMDTKSDSINASSVYTDNTNESDALADLDFVSLKFKSIHTGKAANFRATISGLNETFSPSWDSSKFVGSPFNYYTYSGIERGVTFNFKVFSLNATEHKNAWDKVNFLTSLVYPQGYYDSSAIVAPLIQFNLGDMFKNRICFIESLTYTYDDNTPWQVTNSETTFDGTDESMIGYRLPMIVDVAVTLKFLESRGVTGGKKFYSFEPVN